MLSPRSLVAGEALALPELRGLRALQGLTARVGKMATQVPQDPRARLARLGRQEALALPDRWVFLELMETKVRRARRVLRASAGPRASPACPCSCGRILTSP